MSRCIVRALTDKEIDMSAEKSSYSGEMMVGQVWKDRAGRTFLLEERRLVNDHKPRAEFRLSESGVDHGRWVSAHEIATQYEFVID